MPTLVTATGNMTQRTLNEISLGGGTGASTLRLEAGAVIAALNSVSISSGGVLRGDGRVEAEVTIQDGGEIWVRSTEQLHIDGDLTFESTAVLEIELAENNIGFVGLINYSILSP